MVDQPSSGWWQARMERSSRQKPASQHEQVVWPVHLFLTGTRETARRPAEGRAVSPDTGISCDHGDTRYICLPFFNSLLSSTSGLKGADRSPAVLTVCWVNRVHCQGPASPLRAAWPGRSSCRIVPWEGEGWLPAQGGAVRAAEVSLSTAHFRGRTATGYPVQQLIWTWSIFSEAML